MKRIVNLLIVLMMGVLSLNSIKPAARQFVYEEVVKIDTSFLQQELNDSVMLEACKYYGISHPEIVVAQAKLESGNYTSKLYRRYNNPLGLYNSSKHRYYRFKHWKDALIAYKTKIQYRHREGENYYKFLDRIGYAEDSRYTDRVKQLVQTL